MFKLGLVGGPEVVKYTVADKMWGLISEISGIDFSINIITLATVQDVRRFYDQYIQDESFIGFNVALPWKQEFAEYATEIEPFNKSGIINTIYKRNGIVYGGNTDPLGIVRGLGLNKNKFHDRRVLIFGAGGAGQSAAWCLSQTMSAKVYVYDKVDHRSWLRGGAWIQSLGELRSHKYDLIINATPLGKYYLNRPIEAFASPLDALTLKDISHKDTILQEMNYLPLETLFLQLGKTLGLQTVSGERMLVLQAIESFKRYFDKDLTQYQIDHIIEKMRAHILKQESAILEHSNCLRD